MEPLQLTILRLNREKEELTLKIKNAFKDGNILDKELQQWKKDYGDLLLNNSETERELTASRQEVKDLREKLFKATQDFEKWKVENGVKFMDEIKLLRKQNLHLTEENGFLGDNQRKLEEELKNSGVQSKDLKKKIFKLEKEKDDAEKSVKRLKKELSAVMTAATERFRAFDNRLMDLEQSLITLTDNTCVSADDIAEQESFGPERSSEGHVDQGKSTVVDLCSSDDDQCGR